MHVISSGAHVCMLIKCVGVLKGLTGHMGMPIQNDNAVVQVPLSNLEVGICAYVLLTINTL